MLGLKYCDITSMSTPDSLRSAMASTTSSRLSPRPTSMEDLVTRPGLSLLASLSTHRLLS
ncbi:hypothetical protein D1872_327720 [compost metagenome]